MRSSVDDASVISELITEFWVATERGIPREMAALMCAEEAEQFLDDVSDPDYDGPPVDPIGAPAFEVSGIRVYGDVALARITHAPDNVAVLFFRHEAGRWTVCADADEDLSVDQFEDDVWPALPADATALMRTVDELRRKPIGDLTVEDMRSLLQQRVGVGVLLPRVLVRLNWDPLLAGDLFPGDLLVATLRVDREHWEQDPVALVRIRHVVDKVRDLGDLTQHGAPHEEIWRAVTDFLTELPGEG
ncbi:contact-dependent growth inhibition system immunity protein [Nocardia sp. 852002-20019_SCH5090214]|uniref:contact-dependent growth inhibition system immunity protein n=1 Tax=Nocardia sp. 852002-20019_SCH5090214 TaxID=1834087 RepID=UPI000AD52BED|nr:contact-dependent growth inhibition system immunity protein [Nocardia sp. 852002-20019_SCH5090214]